MSTTLRLLRSDDLLALEIELIDLAIQSTGGVPMLVPTGGPGRLIVHFPPQHLQEMAYPRGALGASGQGYLSGPSRLVFQVDLPAPLPLTLETLLAWDQGRLPAVLPVPNETLGAQQTAIELPFRLRLAPNRAAQWRHRLQSPISTAGGDRWVELWHTNMVAEGTGPAVWIAEARAPTASDPFLPVSIRKEDRIELTKQSRDATALLPAGQADIPVSRLTLSSLGASVDLAGVWSKPTDLRPAWRHVTSFGRDQHVRIAARGFLHPFGHRASVTTVTERSVAANGVAQLEQYQIVTVVETERAFTGADMPLRRVRLETTVTPAVAVDPVAGGTIMVGGQPFAFQLTGFDFDDRPVSFSLPLSFVPQTSSALPFNERIMETFSDAPPLGRALLAGQSLAFAPGIPNQVEQSTRLVAQAVDFGAKAVSSTGLGSPDFLPTLERASVSIPAVEQMFGSQLPVDVRLARNYLENGFGAQNKAQLFIEMLNSQQSFPAKAQQMGGMIAPRLNFVGLSRDLGAVSGQGATAAAALAKLAGGEFSPADFLGTGTKLFGSVSLTDLLPSARYTLPAGSAPDQIDVESVLKTINALPLSTSEDARAAKLRELLEAPDAAGRQRFIKVPSMSTRELLGTSGLPEGMEITYLWKPEMRASPSSLIATSNKTQLWLMVRIAARAGADPDHRVEGHFTNFTLSLFDVMDVVFDRVRFRSTRGNALDLKPEIGDVTFKGDLDFIKDLQKVLAAFGVDSPFGLELHPTYLIAKYVLGLPSISMGAIAIENLRVSASLKLPFVESAGPIALRFALAERSSPFLVTYSFFAGGGFFALELDAGGGFSIEAAIEFGGKFGFDVGVAKGGVYAMAGIYFNLKSGGAHQDLLIEGYIRAGGFVEILGFVGVTVEFYLGLRYQSRTNRLYGKAKVNACIEVLFFNECVGFDIEHSIPGPGSNNDRPMEVADSAFLAADFQNRPVHLTFTDLVSLTEWADYCATFA